MSATDDGDNEDRQRTTTDPEMNTSAAKPDQLKPQPRQTVPPVDLKEGQVTSLPPTLTSYYSDGGPKAADFVKAVRKARIEVFTTGDIEGVRSRILDADPNLSRTAALALAKGIPQCIERWATDVAHYTLRLAVPSAFAEAELGHSLVLERIVSALATDVAAKNKVQRTRAQNLLRLALNWLIKKRSLDPLDALHVMNKLLWRSGTVTAARVRRDGEKLLLRTKPSVWRDFALIAHLSDDSLARAKQDRDEALQARNQAQHHIEALEANIQTQDQRAEQLAEELERATTGLAAAQRESDELRQHRQLDLDEQKARQRSFLTGRLNLLVSDARDALDFEPPQLDAARQRLDSVRQTITREVDKLNE